MIVDEVVEIKERLRKNSIIMNDAKIKIFIRRKKSVEKEKSSILFKNSYLIKSFLSLSLIDGNLVEKKTVIIEKKEKDIVR